MKVDENGMLAHKKVIARRYPYIEHGALETVHAIVVHQTDSTSVESVFSSYAINHGDNAGAHFLIDRNGFIYQTASLIKRCYHVGKYIKSKCLVIKKENCKDVESIAQNTLAWSAYKVALDKLERSKSYPERYPVNADSIGIELVGKALTNETYESVTVQQQASLSWLISELNQLFSLGSEDIYRHPDVSYKNPGEAASAVWK